MKTEVFLNLEGRRYFVGVLSSDQNDTVFQYADDFLNTRLEISPISVPLQRRTWVFNRGSFGGLPGFASDSLPDGWGNLLLHRLSDASVNFHFDATRSFHLKIGKIK